MADKGRPSDFSEALADDICERLINGESLREICDLEAMPGKSTVLRWVHDREDFRDQYARARELAAESDADDIGYFARKAGRGELEPAAATAAINGLKWSAGKRAPKKYGDKLALTGGSEDDAPIKTVTRIELVGVRPSSDDDRTS